MAEQAEPGVRFTLAPTAGESSRTGPLLVIPLPTDARLVAAVMLAASGWWEDRYGQPLRFGPLLDERDTPYGRALVLCEPPQGDRAAAAGGAGNPAVEDQPPPPDQSEVDRGR